MFSERQKSIYMNAITQLHHPLMRKIKEITGTMYSLRPRSKMSQKKAIINLYTVVEINQCSVAHEALRAVSLCVSGFTPYTPRGLRELPLLSICVPRKALYQDRPLTDNKNDGVS